MWAVSVNIHWSDSLSSFLMWALPVMLRLSSHCTKSASMAERKVTKVMANRTREKSHFPREPERKESFLMADAGRAGADFPSEAGFERRVAHCRRHGQAAELREIPVE